MPGSSHETSWMTRPLHWTQQRTGRHTGRRSALARSLRMAIGWLSRDTAARGWDWLESCFREGARWVAGA